LEDRRWTRSGSSPRWSRGVGHAPIEVVVWLSPDPAHHVLAADIGARFGRVRLELTGAP
jgi:hypothetical protein